VNPFFQEMLRKIKQQQIDKLKIYAVLKSNGHPVPPDLESETRE
jgi:hypothetical protein